MLSSMELTKSNKMVKLFRITTVLIPKQKWETYYSFLGTHIILYHFIIVFFY